jgi:iron complex outermembrane receptor protein
MKQKRQIPSNSIGAQLCVLVSAFVLCASSLFGQVSKKFAANPQQVNLKNKVSLLDLLSNMQKQSGYTFIFDEKIINNKTFQFDESTKNQFNQLLLKEISKQTGLQFTVIAKNTFVIKRKQRSQVVLSGYAKDKLGQALVGVNLLFSEQNKGLITDNEGYFETTIPKGTHSISASYIGFETISKEIKVDGYEDIQIDFEFNRHLKLEEILVVGNRFFPKSFQETAVPVDIINQAQLEQSIQQELAQTLQYASPSFHSTHQNISDGTDHIDPISLKGLGPDQVLVLVNGKRRHFSSLVNVNGTVGRGSVGTDLNAIPIIAIKKVEILKDGAAALYGSDAISGVINLQLKESINQGSVQLQTGLTEKGDGNHYDLGMHYGLKTFKQGHTNISFYLQNRTAVNRSGAYQGPIYGDDRDENLGIRQAFFEQTGFDNNRVMNIGQSAMTNTGLFINMAAPIGANLNYYNHSSFNYRHGKANGFYRFPYQKTKQSGLYPFGFLPLIQSDILDFSSVNGIKGKLGEWEFDFSNNLGQNGFDFCVHNSNNASAGLNSLTSVDAGGFSSMQNLSNLDVTYQGLFDLPINIAFGSEFRLEKYTQKAGSEMSWRNFGEHTLEHKPKEAGFQAFRGFKPENATRKFRNNVGFYGEIEGEINSKWLVALASRFENYSDFGANISWKVASRYRITPKLTIRSAYNTGFRAPSLQQNYFSSLSLQFLPEGGEIMAMDVAHAHHNSPIIKRVGIPKLKAETSKNLSIGFAMQALKDLTFTVDAYHISIKDRIVLSGHLSSNRKDELHEILTSAGVDKIQFFTNAINTQTKGIDLSLNYNKQIQRSRLGFYLGFHTNKTNVIKQQIPSVLLQNYKEALFSREEVARLEHGQPATKLLLSLDYQLNNLAINIRSARFGKVQYIHPSDGISTNWVWNQYSNNYETRDQLFAAKWVTDIDFSIKSAKGFRVILGLSNVFNVYPDKHQHFANTNQGVLQYSRRVQQFGVKGRHYVLKLVHNISEK